MSKGLSDKEIERYREELSKLPPGSISRKMIAEKIAFNDFLNVFEISVRDMLCEISGKEKEIMNAELLARIRGAKGFNEGAMLYITDRRKDARKRIKANANSQMLSDWFLFSVLEGKHKWSK